MGSNDLLTSLIEVGIGIAGFASIVAAIARGEWSERAKVIFPWLLSQSAVIILFSILPLLLWETGLNEPAVWFFSSIVFIAYLAVIIPYRTIRLRRVAAPESSSDRSEFWSPLLGTVPTLLLLANIFWVKASWPYSAAMMCFIALAFINFYRLLHEFWER